jgi:pimeloyl-ACP methyl ester carboxylesterase
MSLHPKRLILIHGAWAGAWGWDRLGVELASLGWLAEALDLPGDGFHPIAVNDATEADYHRCLTEAIHAGPTPVALVGHSGGGMLVTSGAIAHPDLVSHGIWVAGMLIPDGRSFDDIQEEIVGPDKRFGVTPHVVQAPDGLSSTVPKEAAMAHFFQDASPAEAEEAAARLTPQPSCGHRLRTTAGTNFDGLPKLYVRANEDHSVLPEAQSLMSENTANLAVVEMATGHVPQLTKPYELALLIVGWLKRQL